MFRLHPLFISLVTAFGILNPTSPVWAATLKPFTPEFNDNHVGVFCICNGSTQTLSGNQQFAPGQDGGGLISTGILLSSGRIISWPWPTDGRVTFGDQNYLINVPDVNGSGNNTLQVYNSASISTIATDFLPNFYNVNDGQYIDARVAQVSNGTINIDIGQAGAATTASTNGWSMAAKQSQLFTASGTGTMNWNSANRIAFFGSYTPYTYQLSEWYYDVANWQGPFTVTTLDNNTTSFDVNDVSSLRAYNNWLIEQLQSGNLSAGSYNGEFNKAISFRTDWIAYVIDADEFYDEVTIPIGERIVLAADGPNARATVGATGTLEVVNAISTGVRISNGASAEINGKLAGTGSSAIEILFGSSGVNNGTINGGFFNNTDGSGVDATTLGSGSPGVYVQDGSSFTNNGVINAASDSVALALVNATGVNHGNINVGVNDAINGGSSTGLAVISSGSSFTNAADGTIYLGRSPQNSLTDVTTDTAIDQSRAITQNENSSVVNDGRIVIGTHVRHGVAMRVDDGPDARMQNNGVIDINSRNQPEGAENVGMLVSNSGSGGLVGNAGTINLNGDNGTGIKVIAADDNSASAYSTGIINVHSGTASQPNHGAVVSGSQANFIQTGTLNLYGDNVIGAEAQDGATLTIHDTSSVIFHDPGQVAYQTSGSSRIDSYGGVYDVTTAGSTLYRLSGDTIFNSQVAAQVTLSGANSIGVDASAGVPARYGTTMWATDNYTVNGDGAIAIRGTGGVDVFVTDPILLNGNNTVGVSNKGGDSYTRNTSAVMGAGNNAIAFDVGSDAVLHLASRSSINLSGANSTGIRAQGATAIFNESAINVASGIGIDISEGETRYWSDHAQINAGGVAAMRVGNNGSLAISGDPAGPNVYYSTIWATGGADTILLDKGATSFTLNGTELINDGGGSAINNRAEISTISLQDARATVTDGNIIRTTTSFDPNGYLYGTVYGAGANGILFSNEDGSTTSNDLIIPAGYNLFADGGATAVRANTTGRVIANGAILIQSTDGGSAIITSTASEVINRGVIVSLSLISPIIDLRGGDSVFINEGNITAPYPETVVVAGGATNDQIALIDGSVVGDINTGNGTDMIELTGGTLDGSLTLGSGENNLVTVQGVSLANTSHIITGGGTGSTLNFSNIAASGGSFAGDDLSRGVNLGAGWSTVNFYNTEWTLTDSLKLAHSTINIDAASTLFVGNDINPVLSGATDDSLVVNNAGTLDFTNGGTGNTLTINGELVSMGGSVRLRSQQDAAGSLSDNLRVNGNVSGTTLIDDTLSTATLADADGDGTISAREGISVAQVSGNASASSFALKRGYLAAGPWQYGLYSFAPGNSDAAQRLVSGSGDQFWDYRLANNFICENGTICQPQTSSGAAVRAVRPAVIPQLPSYISAPVGLAYYSLATTGDLHQRLGELRQNRQDDRAEMFIRYSGSDQKYKSNRDLSHYGYDFDLDYSAVQLGGNLLRLDGEQDSLRGGIAYTRGNARIRPDAADGYSSTSFDSDSVAVYGTWQRDSGFYLDGALSLDWHRGETDIARQKEVAKLKGKGWTASLESGYPLALGNGVRLAPQAQLLHLHLKMDNFTDQDQTRVNYDDYDQTIGRVGARLDRTWQDESNRQYTPYLRTNYYHGWGCTAQVRAGASGSNGSEGFDSGKFGQMWDVGVGGNAAFRNDVSLYAEADYRKEIDGNGVKGWQYNAGVRWVF